MPSNWWTLRSKNRLLEVSAGGRWYLGFTLALGIAAIYSGNNIIYLLESLLLSALLLSGVLSELTISRVAVTRVTGNIHAGIPGEDVFQVENLGRLPLYCLELGEIRGKRREFTAFLLLLPGRAKVQVRSRQKISVRGRHRWDGVVVATSFPFGFARKLRIIHEPGSRLVWPHPKDPGKLDQREVRAERGELEVVTGEVIPTESWQDVAHVHWPISARAGILMSRPLRHSEMREEVWLDLRDPSPAMEQAISSAAGALSRRADTLVLVSKGERKRVEGAHRALNALALLPKEDYEVELA